MSVRMNLVLSDELNSEIDKIVSASETTKSEIIRKALQIFLAAQDGKKQGLKLGLVDGQTRTMTTEFIGL
ncbi:ribbon-helix-helix domain-containing protein [Falsirhodobacter xinxiangensis]|uniref:ribbon-helix-helix domain-containing protein n=1 Tax=Falsirhodobacter xinxiangensis TaxID=2530049 RepID=UPI0010AA8F7B|nr:transcriptional regulator [Rhodobacter xinxiangensis]